jgi:hypothetical protein
MPWQLQQPGGLTRFVRHVSDPVDPHYRQYATVESLVARYGGGSRPGPSEPENPRS